MDLRLGKISFIPTQLDPCLYTRVEDRINFKSIICVHVDDIAIASVNSAILAHVKTDLASVFELKDLGKLHHITGYEIRCNLDGSFVLHQEHYCDKILKWFDLISINSVGTLLEPNVNLSRIIDITLAEKKLNSSYAECIGSLM